jgi:hypothetical protein
MRSSTCQARKIAMPKAIYYFDPVTHEVSQEWEIDEVDFRLQEERYEEHRQALLERQLFDDIEDFLTRENLNDDVLVKLKEATSVLVGLSSLEAKAAEKYLFCWGSVVVQGTVNMFAGGAGSGKSSLLFLLIAARSAIAPTDVLGMPVAPMSEGQWGVLIEGEHGERSTARKLLRSADIIDVSRKSLGRVVVIARKAVKVGDKAWKAIEALAAAGLIGDVYIDTLARVSGAVDPNDEQEQIKLFERFTRLIELAPTEATAPTIWIAAHTRKNVDGGLSINDVSGSAQRVGQVDSLFGIAGQGRRPRTLKFLKLREEPDEEPEDIKYRLANGELVVLAQDAPKKAPGRPQELPARVLQVLRGSGSGARRWTKNRLHQHLKTASFTSVKNALESLEKRGLITREQEGDTTFFVATIPTPEK